MDPTAPPPELAMTAASAPDSADHNADHNANHNANHGTDHSAELCDQIAAAHAAKTPLRICGGSSKIWYGRPVNGTDIDLTRHRGITHYDPIELVLTARAGTPLSELEATLAAAGQQLAFEPPHFSAHATLGGTVATGLSGPRRPWVGAARDFVLGLRLISAEGKHLRFGGEVMKNVAGYDVARLMVGAQGTLGVITEVSLKVLPVAPAQASLVLELPLAHALQKLAKWGRQPIPLSAAAWHQGQLHLRLEGGIRSVAASRARLGGQELDPAFWTALREHQLPFFSLADDEALWRLALPANTPALELPGACLLDWGGAQRWLRSNAPASEIRARATENGGHAVCYTPGRAEPFTPLPVALARYHQQLKAQLDPHRIFNPGRLYPDL